MIQSTTSENDSQPLNSPETLQKTTQINDQQLGISQNQVMEGNLSGTTSLDIPEFKCPLASCNYTTTNYRSLTIHAAIHSGTRQYKCSIEKCQFHALKRNKVLYHYAEVHSSLAPISINAIIPVEDIPPADDETICKFEGCKYHTKRASDMKYHLKVHSGVKDFECQFKNCHFSAYRLSDLSYHRKLYHNTESTTSSSSPTNISSSSSSSSLISSSINNNNITTATKRRRNQNDDLSNISVPIDTNNIINNYNNTDPQQQQQQQQRSNNTNNSDIKSTSPVLSELNNVQSLNQQIDNNNNNNKISKNTSTTTTTSSVTQSSSDGPQHKRICCIKQSCPINGCPLIFDSYNHMLQHLYVHTGEKLYKCSIPNCSFTGSRISSIREHAKSIHPTIASVDILKLSGPIQDSEGYYHCNECTEKYKNLVDYRVHLASHKGIYSCSYPGCTYTAIRKSLIQSHLIIHTNTTFSCDYPGCIFKTNNPRAYEKHKKTHQNELLSNTLLSNVPLQSPFTTNNNNNNNNSSLSLSPPLLPPPLPLPSSSSSSLNTMNNNNNNTVNSIITSTLTKNLKDGLFHCIYDNCSYSTIRKCNMKRHFNSHKNSSYSYTPKTEYKCTEPNCPFTTLCSSLFYSHLKEFHPNVALSPENTKEICCSYLHCGFKTHTMKNLTRHKMRMHDEAKNYKCSESDCNKELKSKAELNMHLQNHRQKKIMTAVSPSS